jgi:CRISPR-associated exonuclease Cas4
MQSSARAKADMPSAENTSASTGRAPETIPISALNHFLYCPRRAFLIHVEGVFIDNEHTVLGDLAHEHVDFPGYEQRAGWRLLRALLLFSDKLGLSGKADLVEVRYAPFESQISNPKSEMPLRVIAARPVEYKKGPKRSFDNDKVQLCAQALCLEEMFGVTVDAGAIFYAQSQRRSDVPFDDALRTRTLSSISDLRSLISDSASPAISNFRYQISCSSSPAVVSNLRSHISDPRIPAAELKPQCEGCSLHEVCLPELARSNSAWRSAEERLYTPID